MFVCISSTDMFSLFFLVKITFKVFSCPQMKMEWPIQSVSRNMQKERRTKRTSVGMDRMEYVEFPSISMPLHSL